MRKTNFTPSIVPNDHDETVYLVADNFGRLGRSWRESDYEATGLQTVLQDLLTGQYSNPVRVEKHLKKIIDGSDIQFSESSERRQ